MKLTMAFLSALVCCAQTIPNTRATSFAGTPVNLPAELSGKTGLLVIGFSKSSSQQTKTWDDPILRDYAQNSRLVYYQIPVLAGAPALLRGMIARSIKSQSAPARRPHFFVVVQDEAEWKKAAQFSAPDDAYVLVLDGKGQVKWSTHGPFAPAPYARLQSCIMETLKSNSAVCQ